SRRRGLATCSLESIMLSLRHVRKTYPGPHGPVTALHGMSLEVSAGEFVAVRGPGGCGRPKPFPIFGGGLRPGAGAGLRVGGGLSTSCPGRRERVFALRTLVSFFSSFTWCRT